LPLKIAVPDLISNSYFPAVAAVELGFFREEGLDVTLELISPVDRTYAALRDGRIDLVGGSAHSALAAFPDWKGLKLLCAQAQGLYWFLVMRADLAPRRNDLRIVKGRRIGAAPWVGMALRRLLQEGGIDVECDQVQIAPVPGAMDGGVNFGVTAAKAWKTARSMASGPMAWVPRSPCDEVPAQWFSMFAAAMVRSHASTTRLPRLPRPTR